ncbi:MAG TPA: glycerol-3-phosphate dehydrogenase/oxidase [Pirellulales bacterium]|jgi:glycerol-3-phosphate dehydrogenase
MGTGSPLVLILGGGINGCALARELALNGVSSWVVDSQDIASGATSGSSRLIHGGLRYLEYGELALVKESLAERTRLLQLAPQFVHPLRLWIPAENRMGGALAAVGRFFDLRHWPSPKRSRGAWVVRAGLTFYDAYANDPHLPKHRVVNLASPGAPCVNQQRYRWLCAYYDAQVTFPERLTLSMLTDAAELASQAGADFRVLPHHVAKLRDARVEISRSGESEPAHILRPEVIVNAAGAWVDETLAQLHVPSKRLTGGTKGSHLFTYNSRLLDILGGQGIYAEAHDGRPIFITPLDRTVLIGTTDLPFNASPEDATASAAEIEYLLDAVNSIVPSAKLQEGDVAFHYSAVRPLPYVNASSPAAITRRHALVRNEAAPIPLLSIIGGKLTTMRSLAETAAESVLSILDRAPQRDSRTRLFPGAENYPSNEESLDAARSQIARSTGFSLEQVAQAWKLLGTRAEAVLAKSADRESLPDTDLPVAAARHAIEHEWAATLADLIERRLMLLYHQRLSRACLARLADLLVESGQLLAGQAQTSVSDEVVRLAARFGKRVD